MPIDVDEFTREFSAFPDRREDLVAGLVAGEGPLARLVPGRSAARAVSERLRERSFSEFHDIETILARILFPRLASLKLNIIADLRINALFDERYRPYAAEASAALAKHAGMPPLRGVLTGMVRREGPRMTLKFCDLVVRWADRDLYRIMKPVEECIVLMKEGRAGGRPRFDRVSDLYEALADRMGSAAAGALLARMEWDDELREFVPALEEEYLAGGRGASDGESAPLDDWHDEPGSDGDDVGAAETGGPDEGTDSGEEYAGGTVADRKADGAAKPDHPVIEEGVRDGTRTGKYARILKKDHLDARDPYDEAGIRRLIGRIEEKNGRAFGAARAAEIVDEVLAIWAGDLSIEQAKRGLLRSILEERRAPAQQAPDPDGAAFDGEMKLDSGEVAAEPAGQEDSPTYVEAETAAVEDPASGMHDSDGEDIGQEDTTALLAELESVLGDAGAVEKQPSQSAEEDSFLIEDLPSPGPGETGPAANAAGDDAYLIGQETPGSLPDGPGAAVPADSSRPAELLPNVEEFTIKDEILFQDDQDQKRRKTRVERPRKGIRVTRIDISGESE